MAHQKLILFLISWIFVTGYTCAQTAQPLQNPNTMIIGPYPRAEQDLPMFDKGGYLKENDKENGFSYSNNSKINSSIRNFFAGKNYDKIIKNLADEVETGNMLINKNADDAAKGNEEKMLYMALTYRIYLHDPKNEIVWLDKLVSKDNDYAIMRRGDLYEDAKDIPNSIALYQKAVQLGNTTAMVGLAEKYILYERDNVQKPVELFTASVNKNNMEGCMELANLYTGMYGKQYPLDYVKAMNLYLKYLQLTDDINSSKYIFTQRATTMKSIAMLYKNGNGVAKDNSAWRQWMRKSKAEDKKGSITN